MPEQNFSNHRRFHVPYHFVLLPLTSAGLVGSIYHFMYSPPESRYLHFLILIVFVILVILAGFVRTYALKAQDRAIRAEERLRYFILTGKQLDERLRMSQIVALRFADDTEFPALASRAAEEQLTPGDIKKSIVKWKPNRYRV